MTRSPRERFQENQPESTAHAELCVSPAFLRAVDAAMLQFMRELPSCKEPHGSIVNSARVEGAQDFVKTLLTLADKSPEQPKRISSNLPGNVRGG